MTDYSTIPVAKAKKGDAASVVATSPLVIKDDAELLRYGVVRVPLCGARRDDDDEHHHPILDLTYWATELSQVTPAILADQGDGEYAFYRNILAEPDFPFDDILRKSQVGEAMKRHFNISIASPAPQHLDDDDHNGHDDIRLDDAFCVHYNTLQRDSSGARHMDPCDITVNICLQASHDMQGSQVMFHGKQTLSNVILNCPAQTTTASEVEEEDFSFLVEQIPGTATIHWGHHPHQTLPITAGTRTNVVMTYCYSDPRSDATTRTCYG